MQSAVHDLAALEQVIGHRFTRRDLLETALTHPSYTQQFPESNRSNNQRLEFLGDSVVSLILSTALFLNYPDKREGQLTRNRAALARGKQLTHLARELQIGRYLWLGEGEDANNGRDRESILEDALEALIGALYLDCGLEQTSTIVLNWYGNIEQRLRDSLSQHSNPKGRLQEVLHPQHGNQSLEYRVVGESGPDHAKQFLVEVLVLGEPYGRGSGSSKKEAEEAAAIEALERLDVALPDNGLE